LITFIDIILFIIHLISTKNQAKKNKKKNQEKFSGFVIDKKRRFGYPTI